ncbi:circadian clock KaiB family protein [Stenomitos frigidus]|uniref:Circadian clock protein KaiB n=1 Tax=Stenomitos frigidus ULC18 TaxID=2107698 RepID=A0A2T1DTG4_9CYAN|nr:circadian clock KaiB family protein [Stenomitos frigidus]PSB23799.1 circadian clock protein KaiB [Stenomitos frigidus ULC18]
MLNPDPLPNPGVFKGIALFTPGGGLVYGIDYKKQERWHLHLCAALQDLLSLPEPPHFLVPCYTATVDRWFDSRTQRLLTAAEASPLVLRYQTLLNAVFGLDDLHWQPTVLKEGVCDAVVLATYRKQFPQLWEPHDLVVRSEQAEPYAQSHQGAQTAAIEPPLLHPAATGYVLRLFVSGHSVATERTLQTLHRLLEESLSHLYTLKVIDVSQHPEQAELDQVSATPTLVKVWPRPVRRIVGDLDNIDQLLRILGSD